MVGWFWLTSAKCLYKYTKFARLARPYVHHELSELQVYAKLIPKGEHQTSLILTTFNFAAGFLAELL